MKGCLKILKNPMKKPAAARKKKKKRSACMKMRCVMKKKVDPPKIIKRPASTEEATRKRAWRKNTRTCKKGGKKWHDKETQWKEQRKMENVQARAKRAARNGLPYQTKWAELGKVAAAAHAAEARSKEAQEQAAGAHEVAGEAKSEAIYARLVAEEVKSEARTMAEENSVRFSSLEKHWESQWQETMALGKIVGAGQETLGETMALAKKNEERLNTDDRKRGYFTPRPRRSR